MGKFGMVMTIGGQLGGGDDHWPHHHHQIRSSINWPCPNVNHQKKQYRGLSPLARNLRHSMLRFYFFLAHWTITQFCFNSAQQTLLRRTVETGREHVENISNSLGRGEREREKAKRESESTKITNKTLFPFHKIPPQVKLSISSCKKYRKKMFTKTTQPSFTWQNTCTFCIWNFSQKNIYISHFPGVKYCSRANTVACSLHESGLSVERCLGREHICNGFADCPGIFDDESGCGRVIPFF